MRLPWKGSAQPDMTRLAILEHDFRHVQIAIWIEKASVLMLGPIRRHGIGRAVAELDVEHHIAMFAQDDQVVYSRPQPRLRRFARQVDVMLALDERAVI